MDTPDLGITLLAIFQLHPDCVALFDEYEGKVLPLLAEHGGKLERRVRSIDNSMEIHLVWFPSEAAFEAFRNDPRRQEGQQLLIDSKAQVSITSVRDWQP